MLMADIQGDPQGPVSNVWAPPREVEDAGIGLLIWAGTVITTVIDNMNLPNQALLT